MHAYILESMSAMSLAINVFVALYCSTAFVLSSGKFGDRCPSTLVRLHEERPWYLPRYIVLTLGNITLFLLGIVTLCATTVVQSPFRDFARSVQIGFAIMIGFYVFKLSLDSIHYAHFVGFGIPTVHHLLTITLYLVFLIERQNGLCGVLGLVFQADAVFIDTSKLLNEMEKEDHELASITWINKFIGAAVTFATRLILPTALIVISLTKNNNIFTMDLIVVMFYFLSLVFFTIWNLLIFRNAIMGCVRYYCKLKEMAYQRALEGAPRADDRQFMAHVPSNRLVMEHNNLRRLAPRSNINIATTDKGIDRPNNLKTPKMPIKDAIGLQQLHTAGEPSHSRQIDPLPTPVYLSTSDYDPPSTISEVDETSINSDGKYRRLDTISNSASDSSSNNGVLDGSSQAAVTYRRSIADNAHFRHPIPSNIYQSYVQIGGDVILQRPEGMTPMGRVPGRAREPRRKRVAKRPQRRGPAVCLTESEAALPDQLAQIGNTTKPNSSEPNNNNTLFEGISIQQILAQVPDMSAYPQFGERQSI